MAEIRTILVAVDFSSHSKRALEYAVRLAKRLGARVHVLHSYHVPFPQPSPDLMVVSEEARTSVREAAELELDKLVRQVWAEGVPMGRHLVVEHPVLAIPEAARALGADLIVMGTRGHTGLKHVLLGSVAERTLRSAPCPVLTLKDARD